MLSGLYNTLSSNEGKPNDTSGCTRPTSNGVALAVQMKRNIEQKPSVAISKDEPMSLRLQELKTTIKTNSKDKTKRKIHKAQATPTRKHFDRSLAAADMPPDLMMKTAILAHEHYSSVPKVEKNVQGVILNRHVREKDPVGARETYGTPKDDLSLMFSDEQLLCVENRPWDNPTRATESCIPPKNDLRIMFNDEQHFCTKNQPRDDRKQATEAFAPPPKDDLSATFPLPKGELSTIFDDTQSFCVNQPRNDPTQAIQPYGPPKDALSIMLSDDQFSTMKNQPRDDPTQATDSTESIDGTMDLTATYDSMGDDWQLGEVVEDWFVRPSGHEPFSFLCCMPGEL